MKQKEVFLHSEAGAWLIRNQPSLSSRKLPDEDPLLLEIINIQASDDFYSPESRANNYDHRSGLSSFKMDYCELFSWHPDYYCMTHKVRHNSELIYTDQIDEWIAVSLMRKHKK